MRGIERLLGDLAVRRQSQWPPFWFLLACRVLPCLVDAPPVDPVAARGVVGSRAACGLRAAAGRWAAGRRAAGLRAAGLPTSAEVLVEGSSDRRS